MLIRYFTYAKTNVTNISKKKFSQMCYYDKQPYSVMAYHLISIEYHCSDVIMSVMASQITDISIICSTVCSGVDQRRHQSSASLAFVRGIHRWPVDCSHKQYAAHDIRRVREVSMGFPLQAKMDPWNGSQVKLKFYMSLLGQSSSSSGSVWSQCAHLNLA